MRGTLLVGGVDGSRRWSRMLEERSCWSSPRSVSPVLARVEQRSWSDLVPREALEQWLPHLSLPTYLFSASPTGKTPVRGRAELLSALRSLTSTSSDGSEPVIALMGLPNSGKTSLMNALLPAMAKKYEVAPVTGGNGATAKHPEPTTKVPVEVRVDVGEGKGVKIVDTPGWEFVEEEPEEDADEEEEEEADEAQMDKWDLLEERVAGDLLRRNLGRVDRVKDILPLGESDASSYRLS